MPHFKIFLIAGAVFGASGVVFGAFGAHALSDQLSSGSITAWETAVSYQLGHAAVLLIVGIWGRQSDVSARESAALILAGWGFLGGNVLFSGSLYVLALNGPLLLGPVTPVGGIALIFGWLALAGAALRH